MKRILTTITAIFFAANIFAQGYDDACLYSQTYYQGTAKALGMGNALGAVGGDMTAICINPAGMGLYRSNELTTTIDLLDNLHNSTYYGETNNANQFRVTLPNVGYVNAKQRSNYRSLRYTHFGVGLTRINDFNSHTFAKGINPTSSKIDDYLSQIVDYAPFELQNAFPYTIYPAWSTYLIDLYQDGYGSPVPQGGIWQSQENTYKGRSEEWTFAGSANFSDRFFIGISAGLNHIKRNGVRLFEESMPENTADTTEFNQWSFTEYLSSTGWGGKVKVGFIYLANSWLRIGASFHSPTIYNFNESWQTETVSEIKWIKQKYISPESHYEYTFISPLKWVGSLAFVIGDKGIVSFDAEYTNFGAARFKTVADDDYDYGPTNEQIQETYGRTFNFRLGTEWRMGYTSMRAGIGYYGSPYGLSQAEGSIKKASVGISLPVSESTSFDFAYELTYGKDRFTLYDAGELGIEPIVQRQFKNNLAATLKVRF